MIVLGIDFTSRPRRGKPITCLSCVLDGNVLRADHLREWQTFDEFEAALTTAGLWIAGIDFPFGQSRKFIESIGWPRRWADYVRHAHALGREEFRFSLDRYRANRPKGDREHRRRTDSAAGSSSPQKLYRVPVGLMFFEGARRLIDAKVTIPGLQTGGPDRIVVEAYPGILARKVIGRQSYKNDTKRKQTSDQRMARGGPGCLNRFSASISGTSAGVRLPSGGAATRSRLYRVSCRQGSSVGAGHCKIPGNGRLNRAPR